jgi:hypothetical protein
MFSGEAFCMPYMHSKTFELLSNPNGAVGYKQTVLTGKNGDFLDFGDFIELDDLLALPVQVLNRKGYLTHACCAGHPYFVESTKKHYPNSKMLLWVRFKHGIRLPYIPPGFHAGMSRPYKKSTDEESYLQLWYENTSYFHIADGDGDFDMTAVYDGFYENLDAAKRLYLWAINLPDFAARD